MNCQSWTSGAKSNPIDCSCIILCYSLSLSLSVLWSTELVLSSSLLLYYIIILIDYCHYQASNMSTCHTFVDVLLKRYSSTIDYDNSYPFQVFVLGGLSPQKSGKLSLFFFFVFFLMQTEFLWHRIFLNMLSTSVWSLYGFCFNVYPINSFTLSLHSRLANNNIVKRYRENRP